MGFSVVENLSGLCGSIFSLSRRLQLHSRIKETVDFLIFNLVNLPVFTSRPILLGRVSDITGNTLKDRAQREGQFIQIDT